MVRQLTFDLPVRTAQGRENFFVAPSNALALAMIEAPDQWPQGKLLLIGPEGAGKSHLAAVWAAAAGAVTLAAAAIGDPGPATAVLVEDAEVLAGDPALETRLFLLHNHLLARSGRLLITARHDPRDWGLVLPDLLSRMQATAIARLEAPDDSLLAAVMVKQFADRQVQVPPALITYLVSRIERSFSAARSIVAALDDRALALGRPISRALAAELLDSRGDGGS